MAGDLGFEHRRVDLKGPEDEVGVARRSGNTILTICLVQVIHLDGEPAHGGQVRCQSRVLFGFLFEHSEKDNLLEALVFCFGKPKDPNLLEPQGQQLGDGLVQPGLGNQVDREIRQFSAIDIVFNML